MPLQGVYEVRGYSERVEHNLTVERKPLSDLRPHPDNPRNGDTDLIMESLRVNGQYKPIVISTDGTVLAGNHTYAAAMELGWGSIAVVALDVDPHSPEAKRIMLADNRTADMGRYDDGQLLAVLRELDSLPGTGYSADDVEALEHLWGEPLNLDDIDTPTDGDGLRRFPLNLLPDTATALTQWVKDSGLSEAEAHAEIARRCLG